MENEISICANVFRPYPQGIGIGPAGAISKVRHHVKLTFINAAKPRTRQSASMLDGLAFDLPGERCALERGAMLMSSRADTTHAVYVERGRVVLGQAQDGRMVHYMGVVEGPMWLNAGCAVLGERPIMDAVADTRVLLLRVPLPAFQLSLQVLPSAARTVLMDMARVHRQQIHIGISRAAKGAEARCAEWLLAHARPDAQTPGALVVQLHQRKCLIAAQLGVTPETLSRVLRQLRQSNLISGTGRLLRLPDPDGLRARAEM